MANMDLGQAKIGSDVVVHPVVVLMGKLSKEAVESIVRDAILRHRLLRDVAELRLAEARDEESVGETVGPARLAYVRAMIDCHAQQVCLSTLLDVLGYVPDMPTEQE